MVADQDSKPRHEDEMKTKNSYKTS